MNLYSTETVEPIAVDVVEPVEYIEPLVETVVEDIAHINDLDEPLMLDFDTVEEVEADIDSTETIEEIESLDLTLDEPIRYEQIEADELVLPFGDDDEDVPSLFEENDSLISEGVEFARYLAEIQPEIAKKVLYDEQFTDLFKPMPRAVLTDPRMYAEHFRVNPKEDIYQQVRWLKYSAEYYGRSLYLGKETLSA